MTRLLLCLMVVLSAAVPAAAQTRAAAPLERTVAVDLRDVPLRDALEHVARAAGLRLSYSPDLLPARRVTLVHERLTADSALRTLLDGTELDILASPNGLVVLAPRRARVVRGRVSDAMTRTPLAGVAVATEDGTVSAVTEADGAFVLSLTQGAMRLIAGRFGYRSATALIPSGGADQTYDFVLVPAALSLDRLDVIGPRIAAAEHDPTHAVTTLRPAALSPVQPRTFGEVLRAGAALLALPESAPSPRLRVSGMRGATSLALAPPKFYVDGVELAQPQYAGALDPAMIERVEIVRGPQGAALYGSDAIGGVVNIITRKGAPGADTGARLELRSAAGTTQSALGAADLLVVDEFVGMSYAGVRTAGTAAASVLRHGTSAEGGGTRIGVYGGGRAAGARIAAEGSVQVLEHTWRPPVNDVLRALGYRSLLPGLDEPQQMQQTTVGLTLRMLAGDGWTHTITAGRDQVRLDVNPERVPTISPPDSLVGAARGVSERLSLRYTSLLHRQLRDGSWALLTTGAEASRRHHTTNPVLLPGSPAAPTTAATRTDLGAFARFEMSVERLLLSAGLRAEHSSAFGADYTIAWLPAIGAAYATHAGPLGVRWRASWGRAIRPVWPVGLPGRSGLPILENAGLRPEEQHGTEVGVDLDLGTRATLRLTHFDQTVDDLVQDVVLAGPVLAVMPLNIGSIGNAGWEAELSISLAAWGVMAAPIALVASHTAVDSRMRRLTQGYLGDLHAGDRVPEVPASATSLTVSYDDNRTGIALTANRVGAWQSYDWLAIYRDLLNQSAPPTLRDFRIDYAPLLRFDVGLTHQLTARVGAVLRIENVTNVRRGGRDNLEPAPGRGLSLGLQMR